jgi:hypothetical protein
MGSSGPGNGSTVSWGLPVDRWPTTELGGNVRSPARTDRRQQPKGALQNCVLGPSREQQSPLPGPGSPSKSRLAPPWTTIRVGVPDRPEQDWHQAPRGPREQVRLGMLVIDETECSSRRDQEYVGHEKDAQAEERTYRPVPHGLIMSPVPIVVPATRDP